MGALPWVNQSVVERERETAYSTMHTKRARERERERDEYKERERDNQVERVRVVERG